MMEKKNERVEGTVDDHTSQHHSAKLSPEAGSLSALEKKLSHPIGTVNDAALADLGLQPEAVRDISPFAIIAVGWNICNSWAGLAATLALSIASGGTATLIYGILTITLMVGSSAASLAEIASVYPTAGGQYHWTSILAPARWSRGLSYCCGAVNIFGWIAISAGVCIIPPQLIAAIVIFFDDSYEIKAWHIFLMYQALNILILAYNIFLMKRSMWAMDFGFVLSLAGFFTIFVTCLSLSSPKQPSDFVWSTFQNNSGWTSDGIVFLTGLVNPNYIYSGLDGAIHLAEECKNAAHAVPRALMSTVIIGFVTSFAFAVAMVYSIGDFDAVVGTATGVPIYELWFQATRSDVAATVFLIVLLLCGIFALAGSMQTSSRLTWAFGRDDALIWSSKFGHISERWGVPIYALLFNSAVIFIIGCIYLGSTTAFNAMISTGLILQQVSFCFPVGCLMYRGRSAEFLPASRSFKLGPFGWAANSLTLIMGVLVLIFYNFPYIMPVTSSNMNYACVVLGAMGIFSLLNWFLHASKHYHGPRIEGH